MRGSVIYSRCTLSSACLQLRLAWLVCHALIVCGARMQEQNLRNYFNETFKNQYSRAIRYIRNCLFTVWAFRVGSGYIFLLRYPPQKRWQKLRTLWRKGWKSWRRRSPAPFVRSTSATPRSSLASTTTARSASDNWPSEQGPTAPLRAPSAEGELFCLKMTPINCPRRFSSTE